MLADAIAAIELENTGIEKSPASQGEPLKKTYAARPWMWPAMYSIEYGELDQAVIEPVPGRPDDRPDPRGVQVKLFDQRGSVTVFQRRLARLRLCASNQ